MTDVVEPGLRERKRVATHRAIQVAVVELVSEHGLEKVTVEEISRKADVSARTFFNYFASKEAALVGDGPQLPAQDVLEEFVNAGATADLFEGLEKVVLAASELHAQDLELLTKRRELVKRYPQLFAMRMATVHQFENQLEGVIARRLALDEGSAAGREATAEIADRARLVSLVTMAGLRHAWSAWANSDPTPVLTDQVARSFAALRTLLSTGRA